MNDQEMKVLIDGLQILAKDLAEIASLLKGVEAPEEMKDTPAKVYTYEETRAILAEKSRTGFRAEVKAILTSHGVKQLSDVKDQSVLAAIVAEAEEIGNG